MSSASLSCSKTVATYTQKLTKQLQTRPLPASLRFDLETRLSSLRSDTRTLPSAACDEFDLLGTELWNLTIRLNRDDSFPDARLLGLVRMYAFWLIDHRQIPAKQPFDKNVRVFKIGIRTVQFVFEREALEKAYALVIGVLERVADFDSVIGKRCRGSEDDAALYKQLRIEFLLLRITLAWKQNQLDLATNFYRQIQPGELQAHAELAYEATKTYFEIGRDHMRQKIVVLAIKWLERSYDTLTSVEANPLVIEDALTLRFDVLSHLVQSHLLSTEPASLAKARELLSLIEQEFAHNPTILQLHLQILAAEPEFDKEGYQWALVRLINSGPTSADAKLVKNILAHIHVLKNHDVGLACKAVDIWLSSKLLDRPEQREPVETVCVTRTWLTAECGPSDDKDAVKQLDDVYGLVHSRTKAPLSTKAAHACQLLLWKHVDQHLSRKNHSAALDWCRLATHALFANSGELNMAKILRKMLICHVESRDFVAARHVYNQMETSVRRAPLTSFVMYKLAVAQQAEALAAECLDAIASAGQAGQKLLYACVLEAQSANGRKYAIEALQKALTGLDKHASSQGVNVLAMYRITIKLFVSELTEHPAHIQDMAAKLVQLFSTALEHVSKGDYAQATDAQALINELEWFMRTGYNMALEQFDAWSSDQISSLLETCIRFMQLRKLKVNQSHPDTGLQLRLALAHAVLAQLLLISARKEDNHELHLQKYLSLKKHIASFDEDAAQAVAESRDTTLQSEVEALYPRMITADYEASLALHQWDECASTIARSSGLVPEQTFAALADMTMAAQAGPAVGSRLLGAILDAQPRMDLADRAKWYRILYQLSMEQRPDVSGSVVEQVCHAADQAALGSQKYPAEELEWLATTTFNRAVDAFCGSEDAQYRRLGTLALQAAGRIGDGGKLRQVLVERLARMSWDQ